MAEVKKFKIGGAQALSLRIGVDIGGTFTDAVCLDEASGKITIAKLSSTPVDYSIGVTGSIFKLMQDMSKVKFLTHGTTVGSNALIQGKLIKMGLITTKGFRDVLEIGRSNRVEIYDPMYSMPKALIPRYLRKEVSERIDFQGNISKPLDEEELINAIRQLKKAGIEGIAVSFINSYANSIHEEKAGDIIRREFPEALISLSHEITREYREYERTSTTVINLGIMKDMNCYLNALERKFAEKKYAHNLFIMQSNGGMMISQLAKKKPIYTLWSTGAGGLIGMETISQLLNMPNMVGADMGGTSFDVEIVISGQAKTMSSFKVKTPSSGVDGYPVMTPTLDVQSIGAGGGSIAWIDEGGSLHVGPQSAGPDPGPACYDCGGDQPTVTDANVVLGRLNPLYLLGGTMPIKADLSHKAVGRLADYYHMNKEAMAFGILEIVTSNMAGAIRTMTLKRGLDPREFFLVAFGGAGPLHAAQIAEHLEINTVVIVNSPGNFSAWGMLMAPVKHDYVQTYVHPLDTVDFNELNAKLDELEEIGREQLVSEVINQGDITVLRSLDVRYMGQEHTIPIMVRNSSLTEEDKKIIGEGFDHEHQRNYLHSAHEEKKEIVNIRVTVIVRVHAAVLQPIAKGGQDIPEEGKVAIRQVYVSREAGYIEVPIFDRAKLLAGNRITGPAVIEETMSLTYLPPAWLLNVDNYGHLILRREECKV